MILNHDKKFIFLKTRKTASTSIEIYLERLSFPNTEVQEYQPQKISHNIIVGARLKDMSNMYEYYNHMPALEVAKKIGEERFYSYFKFCVLRNPFDKLVSD